MENEWIKFDDALPTNIGGEQVQILFGHPKWATYIRGMYTHFDEEPLRYRLSQYMQDIDRYCTWESRMPTHWMKLPDRPKFSETFKTEE